MAELYVVVNMASFKGLCGCEWPSSKVTVSELCVVVNIWLPSEVHVVVNGHLQKATVSELYVLVNNGQLQRLQCLNCVWL